MISEFIAKALSRAKYKLLEDGTYFGEVREFRGVWANAKTLEACREELREVFEDWLLLAVRNKERVPGFRIKVDRRALVRNNA